MREHKCGRTPACHLVFKLTILVPPSALKTERAKHVYPYLGFDHSRTVPPKVEVLNAGHGTATRPVKVSADSFTFKLSYRFRRTGVDAWADYCTKDTESRDGLNLPGHHGCGAKRINGRGYVG